MIRKFSSKDKMSISNYLSNKLNISLIDANRRAKRILKSGLPTLLKEDKDLQGLCWIETRLIGDKKENFVEIYVNHWKLAEHFLQCLRWELNGLYWFSLPIHDSLNRTLNKHGIRFVKVDGDKNFYHYKFEKREFKSFKLEDNEE